MKKGRDDGTANRILPEAWQELLGEHVFDIIERAHQDVKYFRKHGKFPPQDIEQV